MAKEGEFKANFSQGGTVKPFELTPEVEWLAVETSRLFNLEIAGIDLLFDGDHFKVCEANSSPGFETIEQVANIDVAKEIYHFIRIRLGKFEKVKKIARKSRIKKKSTCSIKNLFSARVIIRGAIPVLRRKCCQRI